MSESPDWHDEAFEVYRLAWSELLQLQKAAPRFDLQYYVEELKEALLDLKQAAIAEEPSQAVQVTAEVRLLLAELRQRSKGE